MFSRFIFSCLAILLCHSPTFAQQRGAQAPDIFEIRIEGGSITQLPSFVESLDALRKLEVHNTGISDFTIRRSFAYLDRLTIHQNNALTTVKSLFMLAVRDLYIQENDALTTIANVTLPGTNAVLITNNNALQMINGLNILSGGGLKISGNPALSAIENCQFATVRGILEISNNPQLKSLNCSGPFWSAAETVNLSRNDLDNQIWTPVPSTAGQIRALNLARNPRLTNLPPILAFSQIRELNLFGTGLTEVPAIVPYLQDLSLLSLDQTCMSKGEYELFYATFKDRIQTLQPLPQLFRRGAHCAP